MKIRYIVFLFVILVPATDALAHIDGAHTGSIFVMLLHILQSPEHLIVMLVMVVVVSLLVRLVIKKRAIPSMRSKLDAKSRTAA